MFRNTCIVLITLLAVCVSTTAEETKYSLVEIKIDKNNANSIHQLGLATDCCGRTETRDGEVTFQVPVSQEELKMLKQQRSSFKVIIDDMSKHYQNKFKSLTRKDIADSQPRNTKWKLGSMAGAYTPQEYLNTLDYIFNEFKSTGLIAEKKSIGKTHEGRDIFMIKISDNVNQEENEPAVLYTGAHHARESASPMTVTRFMFYLLENYETSARVKNIVNNRELYFIPIINFDSYVANHRSYPNGGGMVRKNQNGVDLNRNYGPMKYWNYPNSGSSTSPWSQTYRGPSPFSEAETKVVRDFVLDHTNIRTCLNYHSYSDLLIYPLGIKDQIAHNYYRGMASRMTQQNGYRIGTAEYLLYAVRGVSDDWFDEVGVFAMTPEVGGSSDGFWPGPSRMVELTEENIEANLQIAEESGKVPSLREE
ncbi:M14 family metallopeptidase [Candidatus Uabimicrobium sp. HlEnr_7]|uniref:M14 family metallopeptidase n=1 Tax=Candidatus Uabimicrobium helgolandensis TaxID=3095367 RepID=UPI003556C0D6